MRNLGLIVTLGALAIGGSAFAGVTNIRSTAGNIVTVGLDGTPTSYDGPGATPPGKGNTGKPPGAAFDSFVHLHPGTIEFESQNTTLGEFVQSYSYSAVSFDINAPERSTFGSTITPAGLGFYLADTSAGCFYTRCAQIDPDAGVSFADLSGDATMIGEVGFNFSVRSSASEGLLYSLSGSLILNADGSINDNLGQFPNIEFQGSGTRSLTGFGDAVGNDVEYNSDGVFVRGTGLGYRWDATDFQFNVPFGEQTLTYTTEVYSRTFRSCKAGGSICVIALSGFGDPVGRGGGNEFARSSADPRITGIHYSPTVFAKPTFENGRGSFQAAVPEPATWLAMVLGFGLLGSALRRKRTVAFV